MYISTLTLFLLICTSMFIGHIIGKIDGEARIIAEQDKNKYKH